jgi:hypothetical protein
VSSLSVADFWVIEELPGSFAACEQLVARANAHVPLPRDCPNPLPVPHTARPRIKWPLRISWSGVRRFGDFNDSGTGFCVVGERVRGLVEENGLKGFIFRELKFVKHTPIRDQAFAPNEVEGKFWALDAERTLALSFGPSHPVEVETVCERCGWTEVAFPRKGELSVLRDGWDGHDVFRLKYLDHFCVSSRFRKLVRAAKLTLVDFFPLADFGSPSLRKQFWGPISKRKEEWVRQNERSARRLAIMEEGRYDDPELRRWLASTRRKMQDNKRRNDLVRRRALRRLRESDYGYLS